MNFPKNKLIWLLMVSTLSMANSSCGNKGKDNNQPAVTPSTPQTLPVEQAEVDRQNRTQGSGQDNENDQNNPQTSNSGQRGNRGTRGDNNNNSSNHNPGSSSQNDIRSEGAPPSFRPERPSSSGRPNLRPRPRSENDSDHDSTSRPNDNDSNAEASESDVVDNQAIDTSADPLLTGYVLNNNSYTSAGSDSTLQLLSDIESNESDSQQEKNIELAGKIALAKLNESTSGMPQSIDLEIMTDSGSKTFKMKISSDHQMSKLSLTSSSVSSSQVSDLKFKKGYFKCVDKTSKCSVSIAKITIGDATTRIIFRKAVLDRHFIYPVDVNSTALESWKDYILNSINFVSTSRRIESVIGRSFEVVNGPSVMDVMMKMKDKEEVSLRLPMVTQFDEENLNIPVFKLTPSSSQNVLATSISQARMLINNGRGQFQLEFDLGFDQVTAQMKLNLKAKEAELISDEQIESFDHKAK